VLETNYNKFIRSTSKPSPSMFKYRWLPRFSTNCFEHQGREAFKLSISSASQRVIIHLSSIARSRSTKQSAWMKKEIAWILGNHTADLRNLWRTVTLNVFYCRIYWN